MTTKIKCSSMVFNNSTKKFRHCKNPIHCTGKCWVHYNRKRNLYAPFIQFAWRARIQNRKATIIQALWRAYAKRCKVNLFRKLPYDLQKHTLKFVYRDYYIKYKYIPSLQKIYNVRWLKYKSKIIDSIERYFSENTDTQQFIIEGVNIEDLIRSLNAKTPAEIMIAKLKTFRRICTNYDDFKVL